MPIPFGGLQRYNHRFFVYALLPRPAEIKQLPPASELRDWPCIPITPSGWEEGLADGGSKGPYNSSAPW